MPEEMYTLVDIFGRPVYTHAGMDGHFTHCRSLGDMMTFTRKMGWSHMMHLAEWPEKHQDSGRMKVYPAKVTLSLEIIH